MTYNVNNGTRVAVVHPSFTGQAGLVESRGVTMLAFVPTDREKLSEGGPIEVAGEAWQIASVRRSSTVKNMAVLTITRCADEGVS